MINLIYKQLFIYMGVFQRNLKECMFVLKLEEYTKKIYKKFFVSFSFLFSLNLSLRQVKRRRQIANTKK